MRYAVRLIDVFVWVSLIEAAVGLVLIPPHSRVIGARSGQHLTFPAWAGWLLGISFTVLGIVLLLACARSLLRRRNWVRWLLTLWIVVTAALVTHSMIGNPKIIFVVEAITTVPLTIGLVVLLFMPASNRFFAADRASDRRSSRTVTRPKARA